MSWTYSDFEQQSTDSARLTRLRLHLEEVADAISANVASQGHSRSSDPNFNYWSELNRRREVLETSRAGTRSSGGLSRFMLGG